MDSADPAVVDGKGVAREITGTERAVLGTDGYAWLDAYAQRAADQIKAHRAAEEVVVGHADRYAGNAAVAEGVLVATFDWELVVDAEAVIAGFTDAGRGRRFPP